MLVIDGIAAEAFHEVEGDLRFVIVHRIADGSQLVVKFELLHFVAHFF